jgi:hypothetical protein
MNSTSTATHHNLIDTSFKIQVGRISRRNLELTAAAAANATVSEIQSEFLQSLSSQHPCYTLQHWLDRK